MNAAQWQLGRESDNQMKLSHSCNMNLSVCRFTQSFRFTLLETDGDRKRWLSAHYHKSTHTHTHRLLFVYQAGTGQNTKPALICMDIWSVCGCECVWMAKAVICTQVSLDSELQIQHKKSVLCMHLMQCCGRSHGGYAEGFSSRFLSLIYAQHFDKHKSFFFFVCFVFCRHFCF